jgi:hypothetical protein
MSVRDQSIPFNVPHPEIVHFRQILVVHALHFGVPHMALRLVLVILDHLVRAPVRALQHTSAPVALTDRPPDQGWTGTVVLRVPSALNAVAAFHVQQGDVWRGGEEEWRRRGGAEERRRGGEEE